MTLRTIVLAALCAVSALAQTYSLAPDAKQSFYDANGNPISGCLLWTYAAGTTNPLASYQNSTGTLNSNPIVCNASGQLNLWLGANTYKFVLEAPPIVGGHGSLVWSVDNIVPVNGSNFLPLSGGTMSGDILGDGAHNLGSNGARFGSLYLATGMFVGGLVSVTATGGVMSVVPPSDNTGNVGSNAVRYANMYGISEALGGAGTPGVLNMQKTNNFRFTGDDLFSGSVVIGSPGGIGAMYPANATTDLGTNGIPFRNVYGATITASTLLYAPALFQVGGVSTFNGTLLPSGNNTITVGSGAAQFQQMFVGALSMGSSGGGSQIQMYNSGIPFLIQASNSGGGSHITVGNAVGYGAIIPVNATQDIGTAASPWRVGYFSTIVTGAGTGFTGTKTVRASGGAADCTLVYQSGVLLGGGTC